LTLQSSSQHDDKPERANFSSAQPTIAGQPYVIRFFQRIFRCCPTVAHLNQALTTLEHRLTPPDVKCLCDTHRALQLIPPNAPAKFHKALTIWLSSVERMMLDSGKSTPEAFVSRKVSPTVTHYSGPGIAAEKTLLVCFTRRGRTMMMPDAVFLQHTSADQFDVLMVTDPRNEGYRHGALTLGNTVTAMIRSISKLELTRSYRSIRTLGCSAGCYPAVIAGYLLGAELAVSAGGRFHSWRHPMWILERIVNTWRAVRNGRCSRVLMCYDIDKTRDRNYSRLIAWLTGGSLVAIEFSDGIVGHRILARLAERGELAPYSALTVFADMNSEHIQTSQNRIVLNLPSGNTRALK